MNKDDKTGIDVFTLIHSLSKEVNEYEVFKDFIFQFSYKTSRERLDFNISSLIFQNE